MICLVQTAPLICVCLECSILFGQVHNMKPLIVDWTLFYILMLHNSPLNYVMLIVIISNDTSLISNQDDYSCPKCVHCERFHSTCSPSTHTHTHTHTHTQIHIHTHTPHTHTHTHTHTPHTQYRSLLPMYYRNAAAAIVVYDITSEVTFEVLQEWITELNRLGPPNIIIAMAGNKCDLEENREVR